MFEYTNELNKSNWKKLFNKIWVLFISLLVSIIYQLIFIDACNSFIFKKEQLPWNFEHTPQNVLEKFI